MALVAPGLWEDPYELAGNNIGVEWLDGGRIKQTSITLSPVMLNAGLQLQNPTRCFALIHA